MKQNRQFSLPAPGKLNLCLNIIGQRADGYHELQTVFQLISRADRLDFALAEEIEVISHMEVISDIGAISEFDVAPKENLVYRAATLLAEYAGVDLGAKLTLHKILPMGAGLGGGSSDAATTLRGLNFLWQLGLGLDELLVLGQRLGADVPVFVMAQSAWAEGIGERLRPIMLPPKTYLVVQPDCFISTSEIFSHSELTRSSTPITIARFLEAGSGNDCEAVARKLYPQVDQALLWLNHWGAAKMTGTGSCVFLEFGSIKEAEAVRREVPASWHAFVTEGLNESPLISALTALERV